MPSSVPFVLLLLTALQEPPAPSPLDSALVVPNRCEPEASALTLVVLHGYGTPARELRRIRRAYARAHCARLVIPRGEVRLRNGRVSWWRAPPGGWQPSPERWRAIEPGMQAARRRVRTLLGEVRARFGIDNDDLILAGFSQGATLAMAVALEERRLAGLVLCSGRFGGDHEWLNNVDEMRVRRTVVAHGRKDRVAPYWGAAELGERLVQTGTELHWLEYAGGHRPPARADQMLHAALRETARRASYFD